MSNLDTIKSYLSGVAKTHKIGYTPEIDNSKRKEGENWIDKSGNTWVIKNGMTTKIPSKPKVIYRQICNVCGRDIRFSNTYYLDTKTWYPTGMCYDCFFENETKMKQNGTWENFDKKRTLQNEYAVTKDYIVKFKEALNWCKKKETEPIEFYNSDGSKEVWEGKEDVTTLEKNIKEDLNFLEEKLKTLEKELKELNDREKKQSKENNK